MLFRRRQWRFTTSPWAYTQAACKINKSPPSLDSHGPEVGAANRDKTNGLMGEARAVNHVWIHKQALAIVWSRIAPFTHIDAVNTLLCAGGPISGLFAPIWGRSRTLLAADGAELAVKQFGKKTSLQVQHMIFTVRRLICTFWQGSKTAIMRMHLSCHSEMYMYPFYMYL